MLRRVILRVFSFPVMLGACLILLAVLTARSRFSDPDLWWHLRTGQIIWTEHAVPQTDRLSFTTGEHPWVAHEWLSQLGIFAAWKVGDYSGLMLWFCVTAAALLVIQFVSCTLYSGNAKVAFLGALITWFFATVGFAIRPQMWGYILLACELLILQLGQSRDPRWLLLLPFLFLVWVNTHGSFFFGLIVLAVVLVFGSLRVTQRRMFLWASAFSVAALFVNPVGWPLLLYPLRTMFDSRLQLDAVSEWQRLSFDDVRAYGLLAVAGVILWMVWVRRRALYADEVVLLLMSFGLSVLHQRMLFAWGIIAAPVLCRQLAHAWDEYSPVRDKPALNAILTFAALGVALIAFPARSELASQVSGGSPVEAVEFMRRTHLTGRILNDYVYGGYLSWALPQQKVFIDGRADVYAWTGVFKDYGAWAMGREDPHLLLDKYRIDFCLLAQAAALTPVMRHLPGWSERYSDSQAAIFVRETPR